MMTRILIISAIALALAHMAFAADPVAPAPQIEVVFALDTTGSMSGMIQAAKDKIWSIANMLITAKPTPHIKIGLVAYRDRGDIYITKITPLSNDIDAVYKDLMALTADGGGDEPESVNQALNDAVTKITWTKDPKAYRVVFLVGDSPPHMDYPDDVKYPVTCKLAAESGININTILCGGNETSRKIWQEMATIANSQAFQVDQNGGSSVPLTTPYDSELVALMMDLEGTRIYYGTAKELAAGEERMANTAQIYANSTPGVLADRATLVAKMPLGSGVRDLISDIKAGKVKLAEVDVKLLPDYMQKMTPAERKQYVDDLLSQRAEVQTIIEDLASKRQQALMDELRKLGNDTKPGMQFAIYVAIRDQAGKKHILFQ